MTAKGFLTGVLVGGIAGAAAGLLFAPMKGVETRQKISDTAKSARDKVTDVASNMKSKVVHCKEKIEQAI